MCYIGTYWLYTKKLSLCIPSFLHPWQGNSSSSTVESSYGIRTTEAWLALNEGTNCSARRARNQQWHMGGGPWASSAGSTRPPNHVNRKGVWTFALPRSVHHPANGAHQPHCRREAGWGGSRWTPHTGSLCALGKSSHYCEGQLWTSVRDMGGVLWSNSRRGYCWNNDHFGIYSHVFSIFLSFYVQDENWSDQICGFNYNHLIWHIHNN